MLSCLNIVFIKTENDKTPLLGREAGEYLTREFRAYDYTVAEDALQVRQYLSDEAVNVVLPLDMPLVEEHDLLRAVEIMRRRKISCVGLGKKDGAGWMSFDKEHNSEYFVAGDAFLQLCGAKNRHLVYNSMRDRIVRRWLEREVEIPDTATVHIDDTVLISPSAEILPFSTLKGNSVIKAGAEISASYISDSTVEEGAGIRYSHIVNSRVCARANVGPYSRLRGALIGKECRIGDFVEVKASALGDGVKASHLTYIGDADIGRATNVGCGTVFCNYDGKLKHRTTVGEDCFIGANTNLIAPLNVGDGAFIAAGTTVNKDVDGGTFTIGRVRAETKKK